MGWIPGSSAQKTDQQAAATPAAPGAPAPAAQGSGNPAPATKHSAPTRVAAAPSVAQQKAHCATCGTVVDVKEIEIKGESSGGGALAGGAAGALLGSGLTHGNKNSNAVAVVGGVAGAVVGNEVEKRAKTHKRYDVAVRMEDGSTKTVSYEQAPTWKSGDRVRVADGKIQPL
jgi:outer membrane lipoprotein SlyB